MKPSNQYIYVVHVDNRVSYHLVRTEQEALAQALAGERKPAKVLGKLDPSDYLAREKQYQEQFKRQAEKGSHGDS